MSPQAQTVFDAAMALPMEDRVALAAALEQVSRPPMSGTRFATVPPSDDSDETGADAEDDQYRPPTPGSRLGFARGSVAWMSDDFDEELPPEFWLGGFP